MRVRRGPATVTEERSPRSHWAAARGRRGERRSGSQETDRGVVHVDGGDRPMAQTTTTAADPGVVVAPIPGWAVVALLAVAALALWLVTFDNGQLGSVLAGATCSCTSSSTTGATSSACPVTDRSPRDRPRARDEQCSPASTSAPAHHRGGRRGTRCRGRPGRRRLPLRGDRAAASTRRSPSRRPPPRLRPPRPGPTTPTATTRTCRSAVATSAAPACSPPTP